jgi:hypothetical protein
MSAKSEQILLLGYTGLIYYIEMIKGKNSPTNSISDYQTK